MSLSWPFSPTFNPYSFGLSNVSLTLLPKLIEENNHGWRLTALTTNPKWLSTLWLQDGSTDDYIPVVGVSLPAMGQNCLIKACQNSCRVFRLWSPCWGEDVSLSTVSWVQSEKRGWWGRIRLFSCSGCAWFLESTIMFSDLEKKQKKQQLVTNSSLMTSSRLSMLVYICCVCLCVGVGRWRWWGLV